MFFISFSFLLAARVTDLFSQMANRMLSFFQDCPSTLVGVISDVLLRFRLQNYKKEMRVANISHKITRVQFLYAFYCLYCYLN